MVVLDGATAFTAKLTNQLFWLPLHTDHVKDHVRRSAGASHRVAPQRHTSRQPTGIVVRGQCGSGGSSSLGQATLAAQLWTLIWHEWVDDASDPSDGLSRVGADCPLCKRNGWSVQEIVPTGILRTLIMDVCIFQLELRKSEITRALVCVPSTRNLSRALAMRGSTAEVAQSGRLGLNVSGSVLALLFLTRLFVLPGPPSQVVHPNPALFVAGLWVRASGVAQGSVHLWTGMTGCH